MRYLSRKWQLGRLESEQTDPMLDAGQEKILADKIGFWNVQST